MLIADAKALRMDDAAVSIETITPCLAKEWLQKNLYNRKIRPRKVRQYAADMRAGKWRTTHQGIAFDKEGNLMDGQHRLLAICETNIPQTMMVTRGLDRERYQP